MAYNESDPALDYYGGLPQPEPYQAAAGATGAPQATGGAGPIPTNPDGSQVGGGTPWAPGASAPSSAPPGYHWDPNLAMFQPDAPAQQTTGGGGSGSGGGGNNGQGLFDPNLYRPFTGTPPTYTPPTLPPLPSFNPPPRPQAPAFSYQDFKAPTLEEAQNQPGYQFGVQQGEQALQQSRAAQGLLRTGGTLKDILDYGRNAATQNYGNVLNQNLGIYNTNRSGAVQAYNTNYQTQYEDPYRDQYTAARDALQQQNLGYQTEAANAQHVADTGYNNAWQQYLNQQDLFFNNQNSPFSKYLSLAQLGAANA